MKLGELEQRLVEAQVPRQTYCLHDENPGDACTIKKEGDKWVTYYIERGIRDSIKYFNSEEEACDFFFYTFIRVDSTTKRLLESSVEENFIIYVTRVHILFKYGRRSVRIRGHLLTKGFLIYESPIDRWEPPFENEAVDDATREKIMAALKEDARRYGRTLKFQGSGDEGTRMP